MQVEGTVGFSPTWRRSESVARSGHSQFATDVEENSMSTPAAPSRQQILSLYRQYISTANSFVRVCAAQRRG